MGHHANERLQNRRLRRGPFQFDLRVRKRRAPFLRRMVLRRALRVRQPREIPEQFPVHAAQECENAYTYSSRRGRHNRSARSKPGTLSRSKTLWCGDRTRDVSERTARIARGETSSRSSESHPRLVRRALEVAATRISSRVDLKQLG